MPESSAPKERSALRRVRKVGSWLVILTLLAYGASNLWLSSPWGTGMAEAKLKERTGLDWQVGSMAWSPWNGFTVREARMLQPEALREKLTEPVMSVEKIEIKPYWSKLFRGQLKVREVTLHTPRVTVALEMLAALAADNAPPRKAAPKPPQQPKPFQPGKPRPTPPKKQPTKTPRPPHLPRPQPAVPHKEPKLPPPGLPMGLHIKGASLHVVSATKGIEFLSVQGAHLDMQLFGEDAGGVIKIKGLKVPGLPQLNDLEQAVVWKRPYLQIEKQSLDAGGLKLELMAQLDLARRARGKMPFFLALALPTQKMGRVKWFEQLALEVEAGHLAGNARLRGDLKNPMSWRGDFLLLGENVLLMERHGHHDVVFDEVAIPAVFRQGELRWNGVRVVGEDVSILGNGQVSARDGVLAVTRLVVSPEVAKMLLRALNGLHSTTGHLGRWWSDLDTPDRKMRDLHISGSLADPVVDAGRRRVGVPVWKLVTSTFHFIHREMKEEGAELPPLPNKELLMGVQHEDH